MAIHWKVALLKVEFTDTLIPDGNVELAMKLNPEGGGGDMLPEVNIMVGPENGVITHSCSAGITMSPCKYEAVQLNSTLSPGAAQPSLGMVSKSA